MKILKITILTGNGMDECVIETDLCEDTFPQDSSLTLRFNTRPKEGEKYCGVNFPNIPLEIIDITPLYKKRI